jgi:hypothetical protein
MVKELRLSRVDAAQIDSIHYKNANGFVESRIGFAVELFFRGGDRAQNRLFLCDILQQYHELFSDKLSHFLKLNANRLTSITGREYLDYYVQQARSLHPDEPMDAMVFGYPKRTVIDEPTAISISFKSAGPEHLNPLGRSMLCAYFPASIIAERGYSLLLDLTRDWASSLDILHGDAGYSLLFEHGVFAAGSSVQSILEPLSRYPGLGFCDPLHFEVESDHGNGLQIKSINWLTVINSEIADQLGSPDVLADKLGSECPIHAIPNGIIIQAGDAPLLGHTASDASFGAYRCVTKTLKPVRFCAYRRGLFVLPEPYRNIEETERWLGRFD